MKKITTLLVLLLIIGSAAFAQQAANFNNWRVQGAPLGHPHSSPRLRNTDYSVYLDYNYLDSQNFNTGDYIDNVPYPSNVYYSLAANDPIDSFGYNFCVVAFDSLIDANTFTTYPRNQVVNISVDTLLAVIAHTNHSDNPDTIKVSLVGLPDGNTIFWSTNIITDTGLSITPTGFHTWTYSHPLVVPVNFTLPAGRSDFGVELSYYGDKRDTFAFLAGFGDVGLAGCGKSTTKADESEFTDNSYAYWVRFGGVFFNAPGSIFQDCNGDGKYEQGTDGENEIQNIRIASSITLTSDLGINDINGTASVLNVYPNPAKDQSTISYSVKSSTNVTFNIYDVAGKLVQSITKGTVAPGKYTQSVDLGKMASGIYSFSINTTEGKSFGKIAVTK